MEGPAAPPDERLHEALHGRDLRSVRDLTGAELGSLITLATDIKRHTHRYDRALTGRTVAMLFESRLFEPASHSPLPRISSALRPACRAGPLCVAGNRAARSGAHCGGLSTATSKSRSNASEAEQMVAVAGSDPEC